MKRRARQWGRIFFNTLTAISLLLAIASAGLWVIQEYGDGELEPFLDPNYYVIHRPYLQLTALLLVLPLTRCVTLLHSFILTFTQQPGLCPACGYDTRANPAKCSECGHEMPATTEVESE